jgi:hypothetical protein
LDLADIWYDLVVGDYLSYELKLSDKEKKWKGVKNAYDNPFLVVGLPKECKHACYKIQLLWMYLPGRTCLEVGKEDSCDEEQVTILVVPTRWSTRLLSMK